VLLIPDSPLLHGLFVLLILLGPLERSCALRRSPRSIRSRRSLRLARPACDDGPASLSFLAAWLWPSGPRDAISSCSGCAPQKRRLLLRAGRPSTGVSSATAFFDRLREQRAAGKMDDPFTCCACGGTWRTGALAAAAHEPSMRSTLHGNCRGIMPHALAPPPCALNKLDILNSILKL